ncbi:response regulator [Bacillus mycoides]|uniref:response regulator n=1 Tax=Bacillus mycoides TaxID=1405 RepID=UPI0011A8DE47|nr:response regulator [Bacillus mycoides]
MEKNSILIVDDDQDIIQFINVNLIREGFTVFTTDNGKEALEIINNNSIQLAILDIMMPQMDGIELCRRIREKHSLPIMSLYNESAYDEMITRPNSGKTVSKRLDYFSYKELPTFDLRPQLESVNMEAHIYAGIYDAQCPHECAIEVAELMPNAILTTFEYSNHYPYIEEEEPFKKFVETTL